MTVDWGEEVTTGGGFTKPEGGTHQVVFKGIGVNKKDDSLFVRATAKGPRIGLEWEIAGRPGVTFIDQVTFNSKTAWQVKLINKALGHSKDNLVRLLQPRDGEITETDFPQDLIENLFGTWMNRACWVTLTWGESDSFPDVEYHGIEPATKTPLTPPPTRKRDGGAGPDSDPIGIGGGTTPSVLKF